MALPFESQEAHSINITSLQAVLMLTKTKTAALLKWAEQHGRKVPWRSVNDRYRLAVAEILLQKTKATDAIPVWTGLVEAYTKADALASATETELLAMVGKLGLGHQRVGRLKQMAESLLATRETQKLPGLGPYGCAVLALSQGSEPETIPVDGNIARVVCRYLGLSFERGEPRKKKEVQQAIPKLLKQCTDPQGKLALVYALVDLGDSVCRPNKPVCGDCPLAKSCALVRLNKTSTRLAQAHVG